MGTAGLAYLLTADSTSVAYAPLNADTLASHPAEMPLSPLPADSIAKTLLNLVET